MGTLRGDTWAGAFSHWLRPEAILRRRLGGLEAWSLEGWKAVWKERLRPDAAGLLGAN
jgi:hypothetical protein